MKKIILLLTVLLVGCSSNATSPPQSNDGSVVYFVTPPGELSAYASDTLVVINGTLDSAFTSGAKGGHFALNLVSTLEPSEQVFLPGWVPFAFKTPIGNEYTYSWCPSKDTIGVGNFDSYQVTGYSNGGLLIYVKQ